MDDPEWLEMIALLESVGVKFESGLTDLEVEAIITERLAARH